MTVGVLLSCVFAVNVGAEEDESIAEHSSCVKEHFNWIQSESYLEPGEGDDDYNPLYPSNNIGSCSYVALSLLLSFYDAYWDDRFVPNAYETMGVIDPTNGEISEDFHFTLENREWRNFRTERGIDLQTEEAEIAYAQFIQENSDEYLQMYLLSLAIDQGFHEDELVYGLKAYEIIDFLEFYLYDICGFTEDEATGRVTS